MVNGGHPDHGMGGVASQGSAGSGMESAYGGAAVGVPGGLAAGQNEMSAFLDHYFLNNQTVYVFQKVQRRIKKTHLHLLLKVYLLKLHFLVRLDKFDLILNLKFSC